MKNRITIVDGYRTIAVLGVLWSHIWQFFNNPKYYVSKIELGGVFSFFGTGVDLFFVISGFIMFTIYNNKKQDISFPFFIKFLQKRWLRIAPAFYVALLVYCLVDVFVDNNKFPVTYFINNLLFYNTLTGKVGPGTHFWSLCTEWHFYFLLPILLLFFRKISFKSGILIFIVFCLLFRAIVWNKHDDPINIINASIPNRIIEFLVGIVVSKLYLDNKDKILYKTPLLFFVGLGVAFFGRILLTAQLQYRADWLGHVARTTDLLFLSLGYGIMLHYALHAKSFITNLLNSKPFQYVGKISYSFYLWHWIIAEGIKNVYVKYFPESTFWNVNIVFIISTIILIPISQISYNLLEAFYMKKTVAQKA